MSGHLPSLSILLAAQKFPTNPLSRSVMRRGRLHLRKRPASTTTNKGADWRSSTVTTKHFDFSANGPNSGGPLYKPTEIDPSVRC